MTAASPGIIATTMHDAFYDSHERYVFAIAEQMRKEYEDIFQQGLILQLDAPDLAMERPWHFQEMSLRQFQKTIETHIEAINHAIQNIPPDCVRLHICWGNYDGPHNHDVALADILPILYQAKVGALSIELANPRHCIGTIRAFLDFAHHHGFLPRRYRPYRAKTKGKVERFIGYLRASF